MVMTKNKENIFDEAFGYANFRKSIKASTSHYHRIASISKVFTCAAITKLIDEGYFKLSTCVFPEIFDNLFNYKMCNGSEFITI